MTTMHRISPLVLKIRDRVERLTPLNRFPLWEYGGDIPPRANDFKAGEAAFTLKEHAEELIYCRQCPLTACSISQSRSIQQYDGCTLMHRQQDRMHLQKIIVRKVRMSKELCLLLRNQEWEIECHPTH